MKFSLLSFPSKDAIADWPFALSILLSNQPNVFRLHKYTSLSCNQFVP